MVCWLTHGGRVMHRCIGKLTIVGSDNGLSPGRRQAITWTNVGILLIGPLGTNFSEILIEIYSFSSKKMHLKMSSGKWRPFCQCLNVLKSIGIWLASLHRKSFVSKIFLVISIAYWDVGCFMLIGTMSNTYLIVLRYFNWWFSSPIRKSGYRHYYQEYLSYTITWHPISHNHGQAMGSMSIS